MALESDPNPAVHTWAKVGLVIILTTLATIVMLPAYVNGDWPWAHAPQVAHLEKLKQLSQQDLPLPGWTLISRQEVILNRQSWTLLEYQSDSSLGNSSSPRVDQIALLMHPQPWHSNQPATEWLNITGTQNLRLSSRSLVSFATAVDNQQPASVTARLALGRNQQQTLAMLQWYAWPGGGHPSPGVWFWQDQWSQLIHHRRTAWVAVTLLMPMAPLADLATYQPQAIAIGSTIQQQLIAQGFVSDRSSQQP